MKDFVSKNAVVLSLVPAIAAVVLAVIVAILFARVSGLEDDIASLRADTERIESGAAIFAGQITAFQEQLTELAPTVGAALDEAVAELDTFAGSTLEFQVPIDETVPISTDIVLDRTISLPIQTSLPINETIDTTITIAGPFGVDVPIDVTVPVVLDLPIDLTLDLPINETLAIDTEIPVQLTLPISVDVADTGLATLASALRQGLIGFKEVIDGLG
jgi:hypothetical protein